MLRKPLGRWTTLPTQDWSTDIQLEGKKLWVLDNHTKQWKVYTNKSQGLHTTGMQFDQTERGNRGFNLPKNSLPFDINDNGSVAYCTIDFNPWMQEIQRSGIHTWSNAIRKFPLKEQRLVQAASCHEPSIRNKVTTSSTARTKN